MVNIRVMPKGGKDRLEGIARDFEGRPVVKVRVAAPPEDGKANAAVCRLLAQSFGVAKGAVEVVRGETSREKRILIKGTASLLTETAKQLFGGD